MKLGELIAIGRECKGWTLRDMERETGISNALISQIEHGHVKDPGFSTVIMLVDALGLSLDRVAATVRPFKDLSVLRTTVVGKVSGREREGDQVPGMPHAICHACGLGYRCMDEDCPNTKTNPALVMQG
ncbi:MAG: helix-turn-helix domain-containing protein [Planctomycetota bacterium]